MQRFTFYTLITTLIIHVVLAEYDFEVAVYVGTPQDDEAYAVANDPSNNRFLTGWTKGSLYESNVDQNTTWFVSGYSSTTQNDLIAARQKSSSATEFEGRGVVVSPDNTTVYCCGLEGTRGFVRAFDVSNLADKWIVHSPGFPLFGLSLNPQNSDELYVIGEEMTVFKFYSNGTAVWNQTYGSVTSRGTSIIVGDNYIYFTGYDNGDIVIGKIDFDGISVNITNYGSLADDFGTGIWYQDGIIYVTGYTYGNFSADGQNFPANAGNFSVVMMAVDGDTMQPQWVDVRGPNFGNAQGLGVSKGIVDGTFYVVGWSDSGFENVTGFGNEDILLAIYNETGFQSAQLFGSSESDFAYGISLAPDLSNFYITGSTSGVLDPNIAPQGGLDIFVLKVEVQEQARSKPRRFDWLGIGIAIGFIASALLVGGAAYGLYRRSVRKFQEKHKNEDVELPKMDYEREEPSRKGSLGFDWDISYPSLSIGQELGRGAFGVVHKCRWRNTDCVVKQLDLDRTDRQSIKAFLKEANNVRTLRNHPNVCSVLGVCTNPAYPICIVMEYLPEGNLLDMIAERRIDMTLDLVIRFAKDVAGGMSHLHDENILHCDLACRNLLVDSRGNGNFVIKISDFGLSRVLESETYTASATSSFPVRWTAPEALRGGKLSRASDVWSFGITLWEMIEGYKPYQLMSNQEVITAVCDNEYRLPRPSHLSIPDSLYELMLRCWETKPQNRPSFNQIYEQLSQIETEKKDRNLTFVDRYMNAEDIQSTFDNGKEQKTIYTTRQVYTEPQPKDSIYAN